VKTKKVNPHNGCKCYPGTSNEHVLRIQEPWLEYKIILLKHSRIAILTGLLFTVNYDSCETHYKGYYFNLPSSGIAQTLA